MEAKTNYTLVGLIVLLLVSALIAAMLWLSIGFDKKNYSSYTVYMNEAVSGLSEESDVKFNGVKVGSVKKIELNHSDPQRVILLLNIEQDIPITTSTTATLASQGITGTSYVSLSATSPDLILLKKKPGQEFPIIPAKPSLLTQLDKVITEVSKNINEVSQEIKNVFNKKNATAFSNSLANAEKFSQVLASNSKNISDTLRDINVLVKNTSVASKRLPRILNNLDKGMGYFESTMKNVDKAGKSVSQTSDSAKVAIDALSQQAIPPLIQLLNKLNTSATNLEQITSDVRRDPSVMVRGKQPALPGPGE